MKFIHPLIAVCAVVFTNVFGSIAPAQTSNLDNISPETREMLARIAKQAVENAQAQRDLAATPVDASEPEAGVGFMGWVLRIAIGLIVAYFVIRPVVKWMAKPKILRQSPDMTIARVSQGLPADGSLAEGQICEWFEAKLEIWLENEIEGLRSKFATSPDILELARDSRLRPVEDDLGHCEIVAMDQSDALFHTTSADQEKAYFIHLHACQRRDPWALYHLGNLLESQGNAKISSLLFRAAADKEFNPAIVNFCAYHSDLEQPWLCEEPEAYLRYGMGLKAGDGYWQIIQNVANFYTFHHPKRAEDGFLYTAIDDLKKMGDLGTALDHEATLAYDGHREPKNPQKAFDLYKTALKNTAEEMLYMTGCDTFMQVLKGINIFNGKPDFDFSYDYCTDTRFEQLMEGANSQAQSCGNHLTNGDGSDVVTKDTFPYLVTGMYLGNFLCTHNLALRFRNEGFKMQNYELALALFRLAETLDQSPEDGEILNINIDFLEKQNLDFAKVERYKKEMSMMNFSNIVELIGYQPPFFNAADETPVLH